MICILPYFQIFELNSLLSNNNNNNNDHKYNINRDWPSVLLPPVMMGVHFSMVVVLRRIVLKGVHLFIMIYCELTIDKKDMNLGYLIKRVSQNLIFEI